MTYYDILEIPSTADALEIKKAYRRLALKHHPDRNQGSAESTERFKQIGEAYEVLSDPDKKRYYDLTLPNGPSSTGSATQSATNGTDLKQHQHQQQHYQYPYNGGRRRRHDFDAFAQFDNLFRNDPFFKEAFRDMDDVFARRFKQPQSQAYSQQQTPKTTNRTSTANGPTASTAEKQQQHQKTPQGSTNNHKNSTSTGTSNEGWLTWLLRRCGIDFQMTTYTSTGGSHTFTSYSSRPGAPATNKRSKTYIDKATGRQVTIQSMEQGGNMIEDKYIDQRLVERRVNGVLEPVESIASW